MDLMILGGLGALVLIVAGLTLSARPSQALVKAKRYAAPPTSPAEPVAQRPLGDLFAGSAALARVSRRLERRLETRWFTVDLTRELARANLRLRPGEFIVLWAIIAVFTPAAYLVLAIGLPGLRIPFALPLAIGIGLLVPSRWLRWRSQRRLEVFNKQLPDTVTLVANSLRAGNSFLQAIELVVRETARTPTAVEFAQVIRQVNLGLSLDQAMDNLVDRMPSGDLDLMAKAISIQHAVGGNLSDVLDIIASTIRERVRIKGDIRTLTAQQRLSGYIIAFMPAALFVILSLVSPSYLAPLFRNPPGLFGLPAGLFIIGFAAMMIGLGLLVIRRIVEIEV